MNERDAVSTRSHFLRTSALGAAALATGSLARPVPARAQTTSFGGTMIIGMVAPFTGDRAHLGEQLQHGAGQACEESNRLKGPYDRSYSIRTFDDGDTIAQALTQAEFAVDDSAVVCVIGHLRGAVTAAALDTYSQAKMPLIVPVTTFDKITENGYTNVTRLTTKDSVEGSLGARAMLKDLSPKSVVVATVDDDYGPDVTNGFVREMELAKVDSKVEILPFEKADFAKSAAAMIQQKPDAIYLAGTLAQLGPILTALRAGGYAGPLYASQGFFDPSTISKYGAAADGLVASSSMPPLNIAPSVLRLINDFESTYGPMTPLAAFGYAAAQIVIAANRATGATERNTLLQAIARPSTTYETIVGDFIFTNAGEPQNPNVYFYAVANGAWKYQHAAHPSGFLIK